MGKDTLGNVRWRVLSREGDHIALEGEIEDLPALGVPAVAVSVHVSSDMERLGVTVSDLLKRWGPKYGVASITAGDARMHGQGVVRWPTPDHPDHGMIFTKEGPKKTGGQSKKLAATSSIVVPPASGTT